MTASLKSRTQQIANIAIVMSPWLVSMYVFYWLDASGTWTSGTPHRGKISVAILVSGMVLSFLLQSRFAINGKK